MIEEEDALEELEKMSRERFQHISIELLESMGFDISSVRSIGGDIEVEGEVEEEDRIDDYVVRLTRSGGDPEKEIEGLKNVFGSGVKGLYITTQDVTDEIETSNVEAVGGEEFFELLKEEDLVPKTEGSGEESSLVSASEKDRSVKWGDEFLEKENYEKALDYYEKALVSQPEDINARIKKSEALLGLGRSREAIEFLKESIDKVSDSPKVWTQLGRAHHEVASYDKEIDAYENALEINEDHLEAWKELGATKYEQEEYDEAQVCFERVLEIEPKDEVAWNNKGLCLMKKGDLKPALNSVNNALSVYSEYEDALINKTLILEKQKRFSKAIQSAEKLIHLRPEKPAYHYIKAAYLQESGNLEEALGCAEDAIKVDPDYRPAQELKEELEGEIRAESEVDEMEEKEMIEEGVEEEKREKEKKLPEEEEKEKRETEEEIVKEASEETAIREEMEEKEEKIQELVEDKEDFKEELEDSREELSKLRKEKEKLERELEEIKEEKRDEEETEEIREQITEKEDKIQELKDENEELSEALEQSRDVINELKKAKEKLEHDLEKLKDKREKEKEKGEKIEEDLEKKEDRIEKLKEEKENLKEELEDTKSSVPQGPQMKKIRYEEVKMKGGPNYRDTLLYWQMGENEEIKKRISKEDDDKKRLNLLGTALFGSGDKDEAESCFLDAKDRIEARQNLEELYYQKNEYQNSLNISEEVPENERDVVYWEKRGECLRRLGKVDDGVLSYLNAEEEGGETIQDFIMAEARCQTAIKGIEKGIETLLEVDETYQNDDIKNLIGVFYYKIRKYKESIKWLRETSSERKGIYRNNLGCTAFRLGRYGEALSSFERAVEREPRDHIFLNNLGYCQIERNLIDAAIENLDKALDINEEDPVSWYNQGLALKEMGEGNWKQCMKKAVELEPEYEEAERYI